MRQSILLALLAPGSIEAAVGRMQETIFREHGLVSAIALSPLVPIAFLDRMPGEGEAGQGIVTPRGYLERLEGEVSAPYRIGVNGTAWEQGALFIRLDTGGVWTALRAASAPHAGSSPPAAPDDGSPPTLFPVFEGFFCGCIEAAEDMKQGIVIEPAFPSFTSSTLALVRISTPSRGDTQRWWREVTCSVEAERPLRGRKA